MKRFLFAALFSIVYLFCSSSIQNEPVEETRFLMDTVVRIAIYQTHLSDDQIQSAIDHTFQLMADLESKLSTHVETSDIAIINAHAGEKAVQISRPTRDVLVQSINVSKMTDGVFDPTIGAVKKCWDFENPKAGLPDNQAIKDALSLVDYRLISVGDSGVLLQKERMDLDLGGLAKGYIVDQGVRNLQRLGVQSGIVDAGGDLRIFGDHPKNKKWKIAIQHPRQRGVKFFGVLNTRAKSIATSGDYERYITIDGKRYHHLLDPKTGYPADGCVSVTIVADSAMLADAYATAVFIMGVDRGIRWIDKMPGVEGLVIYEENGKLVHRLTDGLKQDIEIL